MKRNLYVLFKDSNGMVSHTMIPVEFEANFKKAWGNEKTRKQWQKTVCGVLYI